MRSVLAVHAAIAATLAIGITVPAAAQPPDSTTVATRPAVPRGAGPSPGGAAFLSAGATVVPVVAGVLLAQNEHEVIGGFLVGAGALLGPATGYWYGDCAKRGWIGVGVRAGIAAGTIGIAAAAAAPGGDEALGAIAVLLVGGLAIGLADVVDIAFVPSTVTKRNRERGLGALDLELVPCVTPGSGVPALALRWRAGNGSSE